MDNEHPRIFARKLLLAALSDSEISDQSFGFAGFYTAQALNRLPAYSAELIFQTEPRAARALLLTEGDLIIVDAMVGDVPSEDERPDVSVSVRSQTLVEPRDWSVALDSRFETEVDRHGPGTTTTWTFRHRDDEPITIEGALAEDWQSPPEKFARELAHRVGWPLVGAGQAE